MPWRVETVMSQRKEFVALARSEGVIMSELCLRSGISRKTGYKCVNGGGILGHGVSMVSENVRLSGQRKCHLNCSRWYQVTPF